MIPTIKPEYKTEIICEFSIKQASVINAILIIFQEHLLYGTNHWATTFFWAAPFLTRCDTTELHVFTPGAILLSCTCSHPVRYYWATRVLTRCDITELHMFSPGAILLIYTCSHQVRYYWTTRGFSAGAILLTYTCVLTRCDTTELHVCSHPVR